MEDSHADAQPVVTISDPPTSPGANGTTSAQASSENGAEGDGTVGVLIAPPASAPTPDAAPVSASAAAVTAIQRDALIFVPGMVRSWDTAALRDIAADVAAAMNRLSRGLDFVVAPDSIGTPTSRGRDAGVPMATITRALDGADGATPTPVLDLYTLEYQTELVEPQERQPVMLRALLVLLAIIFGLHRIGRLLNPLERSKSWIERAQILYVIGILVLYAVFLGVLFISIFQFTREALLSVQAGVDEATQAVTTVTPTVPVTAPTASPSTAVTASEGMLGSAEGYAVTTLEPVSSFFDPLFVRVIHLISLLGALVWLLLPPRAKLKDFVTNTATDYLAADYYLRSGSGAGRIHGELLGLIDALRDDSRYTDRRIYLVSYSFGSILAINAMFPSETDLLPGSPLTAIHTLITIGCPFDLVRLVRPEYFKDRHCADDALPGGWLNVYTPNDILGSSFRGISDIKTTHAGSPSAASPATGAPPAPDDSEDDGDDHSWENVTGGGMPKPTSRIYVPGSAPQETSALSLLALNGFRAHYRYWQTGRSREDSCFATVVDYLYRNDPVLRR